MKNLIKITLLAAIFVISGCGDDQADQAVQQKQDAKEEQAVPVAVTPVISTETETTITPPAPPADISYTKPPWAVLEQNVYYYPETETSSMIDKAVDMAKEQAIEATKESATESAKDMLKDKF